MILAVVVGAVIAIYSIYVTKRNEQRVKRLGVMQRALEQPSLDEHNRRELLDLLAEDYRRDRTSGAELAARAMAAGRTLLMAVGWVMFIGGGMVLFASKSGMLGWMPPEPGFPFLAIGFIAMSLPVAIRELIACSNAQPARQP